MMSDIFILHIDLISTMYLYNVSLPVSMGFINFSSPTVPSGNGMGSVRNLEAFGRNGSR